MNVKRVFTIAGFCLLLFKIEPLIIKILNDLVHENS